MATTNLPPSVKEDSAAATKLFFDTYGQEPLEFAANDVTVFLKRRDLIKTHH